MELYKIHDFMKDDSNIIVGDLFLIQEIERIKNYVYV